MIMNLFMFNLMIMIPILMIFINMIINQKMFKSREKNSPFECGFEPFNMARLPISLNFFMISMIFLIFDVEITILLPLIIMIKLTNLKNWILITTSFLLILIFGLYMEWFEGSLNWIK
uniref:NADH-ubiquinone oxidoreductase chain 3 n=1 Tax=Foenatopus ruficollis TaxID=1738635 RepID=A0A342I4E5_9HYME|nr:NADH dehydrogenase subunit 3 [Foenatopus ruficollis]